MERKEKMNCMLDVLLSLMRDDDFEEVLEIARTKITAEKGAKKK